MGDVHGFNAESSICFGSFIHFGHDEIQTPAALGISVSTFNTVTLTGVTVKLALYLFLRHLSLPPTEWRAGKLDVMGGTKCSILAGLVNSVGEDSFWVIPEFTLVVFRSGNQIFTLVEIAPTGLF